MKAPADQIRELEQCIDRVKLASKKLFVTSDGAKKRFLDVDELKALSQLAASETRAHVALAKLRSDMAEEVDELDKLEPKELLARIEATQMRLDEMRKKLKPKVVSG